MTGTVDCRFYGGVPHPLQRAIAKTLAFLTRDRTYCFFWESGDEVARVNGYSTFLQDCAELKPPLHAYRMRLSVDTGQDMPDRPVEWPFPFDLETLLKLPSTPLDKIRDSVHVELLAAAADYKKRTLRDLAHHSAVTPLWRHTLAEWRKGRPLRPSALVIDDRVAALKGAGFQYCLAAARTLESWGWEVLLSDSIENVRNGLFRRLAAGGNALSDEQTKRNPGTFDVIFVDIVRESVERVAGSGRLDLDGIRDDLFFLSRGRSVLPFPQIFMLSNLPREMIAHVCHALGADYYYEKQEFLRCGEAEFHRTLAHTISVARGSATQLASPKISLSPEGQNWTLEALFGKERGPGRDEKRRDDVWGISERLYSTAYELRQLLLVKKYSEGFSGALTLEVVPENPQGRQKHRILKIANTFEMAQELASYAQYIQPFVSTGFARIEPHWAVADGEAAISYEYAGDGPDSTSAHLLDILSDASGLAWKKGHAMRALQCVSLLHNLNYDRIPESHGEKDVWLFFRFDLLGHASQWGMAPGPSSPEEFEILRVRGWKANAPESAVVGCVEVKDIRDLQTWYISLTQDLGPEWMIRPGKRFLGTRPEIKTSAIFAPATQAIRNVLSDRKGSLPPIQEARLNAAKEYIDAMRLNERVEKQAALSFTTYAHQTIPWRVVHGDLHMKNIMVENASNSLWVIDYGKTRLGPPTIDYLVLEHDFRLNFLAPLLGAKLDKQEALDPVTWCQKVAECVLGFESQVVRARKRGGPVWASLKLDELKGRLVERTLRQVREIRRAAGQGVQGSSRLPLLCEMLYMFRTLQSFKKEAEASYGPIGLIWAAVVMDNCLKALEGPDGAHRLD